jgi:hypothetical protein
MDTHLLAQQNHCGDNDERYFLKGERSRHNDRYRRNNDSLFERIKRRDKLELTTKQWNLLWGESPDEISASSSDSESDRKKKKEKKKKHKRKRRKAEIDDSSGDERDHKRRKRRRNDTDGNHHEHSTHRRRSKSIDSDRSISPIEHQHDHQQHLEEFGPKQLPTVQTHERYGGDMLPGEASAIAKYVQENKRIPRRGEVGLSSDEIERYEKLGYVMSGSRHQMMNAVRLRKENQVISVEEKKRMIQLAMEEKTKRENRIIQQFRDLVKNE